jgi:adenylate kinase
MKLVLIGIQGSGKSTQGNLLSKQLRLPYLSTGHIFRELAKEKTKIGRYIKETINAGLLVPDSRTVEIVHNYLSRSEYKKGYILDGFPRTVYQARNFKEKIDKAIYLKISQKDALWRLINRDDIARDDEHLSALKKRIELFQKYSYPVIKYYEREGKLATINGIQSIRKVNDEILKNLGKQLIRNQIRVWEQNKKILLAIVGLPGAGKTTATKYFTERNGSVIEFGKIIIDHIDRHHLQHDEKNHKYLREKLRKEYGMAAMAILNEKKIRQAFKKNKIVIIDGMRSWEEYEYLKKKFNGVKIIIVALYADKQIRYKRIQERGFRTHLFGEERDIDELLGVNMGPTIGFADYFVDSNGTIEELKDKLEVVYRTVYYS